MAEIAPVDKLVAQIADAYESLSRQQKVIAEYIEQRSAKMMVARIRGIAPNCGAQASSIVHFAQRLGFSGFSEMQDGFRPA